jgi:hypothetical protein
MAGFSLVSGFKFIGHCENHVFYVINEFPER